MKIGFFSDLHCGREEKRGLDRYPSRSLGKLKNIVADMNAAEVELAVFLGDLISGCADKNDDLVCAASAANIIKQSGIRTIVLLGNHDYYQMSGEEFHSITGFAPAPFVQRLEDVTMIFLDANFSGDGKRYFSDGVRPDWQDANIPSEQIEALSHLLEHSREGEKFWIICHQCLDIGVDERYIIKNADEVLDVINTVGVGKVEKVINGHFHKGGYSIDSGVEYITLSAVCTGPEYDPACLLILDTEHKRATGDR